MTQHKLLTSSEIHEPKGADTAVLGQIWVSDGAGSGAFTTLTPPTYGGIYSDNSSIAISTIGTTKKKLAAFDADMPSSGTTPAHASDQITLITAGDYRISFSITMATTAAGDAGNYHVHARLDGVEISQLVASHEFSGSADTACIVADAIVTVTANQVLTLYIESDEAADTDDIVIEASQLTAVLLEAS